REARNVGDGVHQKSLAGLVHRGRRLLKSEVQEVPLSPDRSGFGIFAVDPATADFQFGRLCVLVHVRAPAGVMAAFGIGDQRRSAERDTAEVSPPVARSGTGRRGRLVDRNWSLKDLGVA